ncbi:hypothetical protein [Algibacillus agarilyticus]|uniref:hypothetical protein n=1 Tax=Algibacillus agarilyticus TaxID=2234133 RepID=UPI000DCFA1FB|nr:hypothetical protein [Algibacillus agarilyticus]
MVSQQKDFSQDSERLLVYSQLCNVFYERELKFLLESELNVELLTKRLSSLSFYIKRAAELLISLSSPLQLDSQNGTWSAPQKRMIPSLKIAEKHNDSWFSRYAVMGLIIPIEKTVKDITCIRLDCIDEINHELKQFHVNEHGWFYFNGLPVKTAPTYTRIRACKALKDIMIAACCGHQWIATDKTYHRTLTLRELLLTSVINWSNLHKPLAINR